MPRLDQADVALRFRHLCAPKLNRGNKLLLHVVLAPAAAVRSPTWKRPSKPMRRATPGCRTAIPRAMQEAIEAEEAAATLAAMTRCPSCAKAFSDVEALKCHAWSKRTCRAALLPPLRAEVEAWDQAPVARCFCPGCGRTIANLEEALKAHAWARPACRSAIPRTMQRAIAAEEAWAKTS